MKINFTVFALFLSLAGAVGQVNLAAPGQAIGLGAGMASAAPDFDRDAVAFFVRAGVTSPAGRKQISDFVKGVKALGVWPYMVCWPMRTGQNAGTGSVVYSLGGLGIYDGTIVNGAVWSGSGIVVENSTQNISTGLTVNSVSGTDTWFTSLVCNATSSNGRFSFGVGSSTNQIVTFNTGDSFLSFVGDVGSTIIYLSPALSSSWKTYAVSHTATSNWKGYINGTQAGSTGSISAGSGTPANVTLARIVGGTTSFSSYFGGVALSDGDIAAFHSLYKSTLGQGLP